MRNKVPRVREEDNRIYSVDHSCLHTLYMTSRAQARTRWEIIYTSFVCRFAPGVVALGVLPNHDLEQTGAGI